MNLIHYTEDKGKQLRYPNWHWCKSRDNPFSDEKTAVLRLEKVIATRGLPDTRLAVMFSESLQGSNVILCFYGVKL